MHEWENRGVESPPRGRPFPDPSMARDALAESAALASLDRDSLPWRLALEQVIETEILPRLMLAHTVKAERPEIPAARDRSEIDVESFAQMLLASDANLARDHVRRAREDRHSLEAIFLELLAPAARILGTMWETDRSDFLDVTIGLGRLHQIVADLRRGPEFFAGPAAESRSALLLLCPGEVHIFGIEIVDCLFQAAGWRVRRSDAKTYLADLRREAFDVVGFSISYAKNMHALKAAIRAARAASKNRAIVVLAGGSIFADDPNLARDIDVDGIAADAVHAIHLARSLLDRREKM